ncbi:c-Myc-binding protein-like [Portunus trituberculatus]|uniref:c-Myc-binding protein n=1 Tax=Portunus trituberculatus TaxID=210409 RepID=A0A5B7CVW1_PORTR|nr:c-Myc-binding protein-like [Portunus trituberculatus]MPC13041.1 C-Myc-binding protein [Portunus trituberculatus]
MDRTSSIKSMDSEREKFRTYIEKTGVMSALTDALVHLYEEQERPTDALGHIKKTLGSFTPSVQHCHMLEEKVKEQEAIIESQRTQINELMGEVANLRELLAHVEGRGEATKTPSETPRTS